jgi:DNA-binding transcriptional LysR family regulator
MPRRRSRPAPALVSSAPALAAAPAATLGWDELRLLLAVARRGRLAEAATDLDIDPSNVGRRLTAIERRLGGSLFERTIDGLVPSPALKALLPEVEVMEAAALGASRRLAGGLAPAEGPVTVAASESFAMYVLFDELPALSAELPAVALTLATAPGVVSLARREADIALRFVRPEQQDLYARRVASLRWSLYGAPGYLRGRPRPDPEQGLTGHRVVRWAGSPLRPAVHAWMAARAGAAATAVTVQQLHVMVEACARGLGLAVLPGAIARGRGGLERALDHAIDETDLWLVIHRDLRQVPRIRAVADALASRLEAARDRLRAY